MVRTSAHDRWPDSLSGRYQFVGAIGEGGMGLVFKAIDTRLNRPVAIKAISRHRLGRGSAAASLRAEALAAARLDHPYICKIYELIEDGDETYIVMEFVEGETLAAILRRGPPPLSMTVRIAAEIAEGLADAHEHGLVHRDVKPSNVMVTPHGHVKLLDFGVAHPDVASTPAAETHTQPRDAAAGGGGTAQYMAPEQATAAPVTAGADLFSLGVVIFECLTGRLPFEGASGYDYVRHLLSDAPLPLYRLASTAPDDLVQLVEQCLEKTPARRPASAAEVRARLARVADGLTSAGVPPMTARAAHVRRRRRQAGLALAGLALAVAGAWYVIAPPEPPPLERRLRPLTTMAGDEFGSRLSPDGQWVSFIARRGEVTELYVQRAASGQAQVVALPAGTIGSQAWSPDGQALACLIWQGEALTLQIVPAFFGGVPTSTVPITPVPRSARIVRWIGQSIYLELQLDAAFSLHRLDLAASAMTRLADAWAPAQSASQIDVRPDGLAVVFSALTDGQRDLWMAGLDGQAARRLTDDEFFQRFPIWTADGTAVIFQSNRGGQIDLWELFVGVDRPARALTASPDAERPESASPDGSISFLSVAQRASAWVWDRSGGSGRSLTNDALSDFAPVASRDGRVLAFLRSLAVPLEGSLPMDSRLFAGPVDPRTADVQAREVGVGVWPRLSPDGRWLAYLERAAPTRMRVLVKQLDTDRTVTVSTAAELVSMVDFPVEWANQSVAWSASSDALYVIDRPDGYRVIRHRLRDDRSDDLASTPADSRVTDLYPSQDDRSLAFLVRTRAAHELRLVDLASGAMRTLAGFPRERRTLLRGWTAGDAGLVLLWPLTEYEDGSQRIEVALASREGRVRPLGIVDRGMIVTGRLMPAESTLYITRVIDGVENAYAWSLETGRFRQISDNTQLDVSFSAVGPLGADRLIGVRNERRRDIWLLEARSSAAEAGDGRRR